MIRMNGSTHGNFLTALPVFNEAKHLNAVLDEVLRYSDHVVVIDDGSTDDTGTLLGQRRDVQVVTHPVNRGYGAALTVGVRLRDCLRF